MIFKRNLLNIYKPTIKGNIIVVLGLDTVACERMTKFVYLPTND